MGDMKEKKNYHIIEKSLKWYDFKEYHNLTINQLRLLISYLGHINSRDERSADVEVKVDWIFNKVFCLGVESKRNLLKAVDYWNNAKWNDEKVFEYVKYCINENGYEVVKMKCSESFYPYIFHIKKTGYVKYRIDNIYNLNSVNQVTIYELLKNLTNVPNKKISDKSRKTLKNYHYGNADIFPFSYKVESFVKYMQLNEKYLDYSYFNKNLFANSIKRINNYTDIVVKYEVDKSNKKYQRRITHIKLDISEQELKKGEPKKVKKDNFKHKVQIKSQVTTTGTNEKNLLSSDMMPEENTRTYTESYKEKHSYFLAFNDFDASTDRAKLLYDIVEKITQINNKKYKIVFKSNKIILEIPNVLKELLANCNLEPEFASFRFFSNADLEYVKTMISAIAFIKNNTMNRMFLQNFNYTAYSSKTIEQLEDEMPRNKQHKPTTYISESTGYTETDNIFNNDELYNIPDTMQIEAIEAIESETEFLNSLSDEELKSYSENYNYNNFQCDDVQDEDIDFSQMDEIDKELFGIK